MNQQEWQERMNKAVPHGMNEPCTCEGCHGGKTGCTGHVIGCTCDIDWDIAAELHREEWTE